MSPPAPGTDGTSPPTSTETCCSHGESSSASRPCTHHDARGLPVPSTAAGAASRPQPPAAGLCRDSNCSPALPRAPTVTFTLLAQLHSDIVPFHSAPVPLGRAPASLSSHGSSARSCASSRAGFLCQDSPFSLFFPLFFSVPIPSQSSPKGRRVPPAVPVTHSPQTEPRFEFISPQPRGWVGSWGVFPRAPHPPALRLLLPF